MEESRAPWARSTAPRSYPPAVAHLHAAAQAQAEQQAAAETAAAAVSPATSTSASIGLNRDSSSRSQSFVRPAKLIHSPSELSNWRQSEAYALIVSFILSLNAAIRGVPSSSPHRIEPGVRSLVEWLQLAREWIKEIPPIQQEQRFGNKAFRIWHNKIVQVVPGFLSELIGPRLVESGYVDELRVYVEESFGNPQRIDYGTGHELNFVIFLTGLVQLGVFQADDYLALFIDVFTAYIQLMQEIQLVYWLEPAGSKGAWGLDDYQFLPFLWGSSQLVHSPYSPTSVLTPALIEQEKGNFLYFACISFLHRMKTGPFFEHSAMLHSLTSLPSWARLNNGLIKMYEEEVINKFPIVQHIKFGRILTLNKFIAGESKLLLHTQNPQPNSTSITTTSTTSTSTSTSSSSTSTSIGPTTSAPIPATGTPMPIIPTLHLDGAELRSPIPPVPLFSEAEHERKRQQGLDATDVDVGQGKEGIHG